MHGKVNNQDVHEKKKILRKLSLYNANVFLLEWGDDGFPYLAEVWLDARVAEGEVGERHHGVAPHLATHRVTRGMHTVLNLQQVVRVRKERHHGVAPHLWSDPDPEFLPGPDPTLQ